MIKNEYVKRTLSGDSQEINIYKLADDEKWNISCTIPKFARKYSKFLVDGRIVINENSGQIVEIHGTLNNKGVSLTVTRNISDEERQKMSEQFKARLLEHKVN